MQYIVTAYDYTDEGTADRRKSNRPAHLALGTKHWESGIRLIGAGILNGVGETIGSLIVCNVDSREEVDAWLKEEPYVTGQVWEKIDVTPCLVGPWLLMGDIIHKLHGPMFGITRHELDVIFYAIMGILKLFVSVFFFIPWLSIQLVLKKMKGVVPQSTQPKPVAEEVS